MTAPDAPAIPAAALDEHLAIVGRTGSGKSYAAKGCVEYLLGTAQRHVVVVDPTGVWWGLRSSSDGAAPGFPVIVFGGTHADVPVTDRAGAGLAEIVVDRRISCVLDVSEYTMAGRRRFLADVLEVIYTRTRHPLHLVLDEADEVAPQRPMPDQTMLLHRAEQIVRRGRSRGLRTMLITQRPAVLHKDVLSQAATLVAMKLTAPQDRDALGAWIEGQADRAQGKALLAALPKLPVGEGFVWWPEHDLLKRRRFPRIATLDTSRTPDADAVRPAPVLAPVDVAELSELLALPDETPAAKRGDAAGARAEGYAAGAADGLRQGRAESADRIAMLERAIREAAAVLAPLAVVDGVIDVRKPSEPATIEARPIARAAPRRAVTAAPGNVGDGDLHPAARKLLVALAQHAPARFTWGQAATLAGLKPSGGHFNAGRKQLRDRALINEDAEIVAANAAGLAAAGEVPPAPSSPSERLAMWCARLPSPAPEMLRTLAAQGEVGMEVIDLAATLGKKPSGGHWNAGIALLRNNGLIEVSGKRLRASGLLR